MTQSAQAGAADPAWLAEAGRQTQLLALVRGHQTDAPTVLANHPSSQQQGLAAYRANAAALAPRALAAAYPTVAQLLGPEPFARFARAHWQSHAPRRGDLACWGEDLPQVIASDPQLSTEAYLPDVSRLDWAVHRASSAADDDAPAAGLPLLGDHEPDRLRLRLRAGTAVIDSAYPIVDIWRAHQPDSVLEAADGAATDRWADARRALRQGRAQAAWVTRGGGLSVQVLLLDAAGARLTQALWLGHSLGQALRLAGEDLDFEAWLILALRHNALAGVVHSASVKP